MSQDAPYPVAMPWEKQAEAQGLEIQQVAQQAAEQIEKKTAVDANVVVRNDAGTVTFQPGLVFSCRGRDRAISSITWAVVDQNVEKVEIRVKNPEHPEFKTFTIGGPNGMAQTGNWVISGTVFIFLDQATQRELLVHEVKGVPCE